MAVGPARAQDGIRNFRTPILTVETGGHHARAVHGDQRSRAMIARSSAFILSRMRDPWPR